MEEHRIWQQMNNQISNKWAKASGVVRKTQENSQEERSRKKKLRNTKESAMGKKKIKDRS